MNNNNYCCLNRLRSLTGILRQTPAASARIKGSPEYPSITGDINFYRSAFGVLVCVQVVGLPVKENVCTNRFFAFHIHSGSTCTGNLQDAFADVNTHYNPENCEHPNHAGDLPPILANGGYAFEVFLTNSFSVDEIIGKTAVIHLQSDDFTTQPSGNAGKKIACGEIRM